MKSGTAGSPGSQIVFPDVKMHVHRPNDPAVATCVRNEVCTHKKAASFVRHVEIDLGDSDLAGAFLPGQAFGVLPPGTDHRGRPHNVRLYSVASPARGEDGAGRVISTTVKRTIAEHWETHKLFLGVASNFLCDLQVGDALRVSGPNGKRFLLPASPADHDYLFFATGTGIAPFRGMLMDLVASACPSRVVLVMGAAYATDLLYDDFFQRTAAQHDNFTYLTALSRQTQHDGNGPMYVQDRLRTERELLEPMLRSERTLIYICGLAGMELGIFQELSLILGRTDALDQYLAVDPEAAGSESAWTRRMIHKQIKPTRRVFLEVYT